MRKYNLVGVYFILLVLACNEQVPKSRVEGEQAISIDTSNGDTTETGVHTRLDGGQCDGKPVFILETPDYEHFMSTFFGGKMDICLLCKVYSGLWLLEEIEARREMRRGKSDLKSLEEYAETEWDYRRLLLFYLSRMKTDSSILGSNYVHEVEQIIDLDSSYLSFEGVLCDTTKVYVRDYKNCNCEDLEQKYTDLLKHYHSMWKHWEETGERLWMKK